jgi:hypothetical protein
MTTLRQIELRCPTWSIVRAAAARQAARDARLDTETVEVMYSLTPETVAAENRDAHDASVAEVRWYNWRLTSTRPAEHFPYSQCA